MDEWLTKARDALAEAAGMPASELNLTRDEIVALLDLAALAAHESGVRTNAPLLCYLVGKAERGADLNTLAAAVRQAR
jgi:hypothetical protein